MLLLLATILHVVLPNSRHPKVIKATKRSRLACRIARFARVRNSTSSSINRAKAYASYSKFRVMYVLTWYLV